MFTRNLNESSRHSIEVLQILPLKIKVVKGHLIDSKLRKGKDFKLNDTLVKLLSFVLP